jgi:hypothetical protein
MHKTGLFMNMLSTYLLVISIRHQLFPRSERFNCKDKQKATDLGADHQNSNLRIKVCILEDLFKKLAEIVILWKSKDLSTKVCLFNLRKMRNSSSSSRSSQDLKGVLWQLKCQMFETAHNNSIERGDIPHSPGDIPRALTMLTLLQLSSFLKRTNQQQTGQTMGQ